MKTLTRREFLGTGAMGLLAVKANALQPFTARFDAPITFQYWVVREPMGDDLSGTLKKMRAMGYDAIEMCSPKGYGGFVKFETTDPVEVKTRIEDAGLICKSSHFIGREVLSDELDSTIEYAKKMGLETIYMSSANFDEQEATLDQWKTFAEESNKAGEVVRSAGLQLGYHNHRIAPVLDGKPQYDWLMELLDPDLVKMQFQIGIIRSGYDPIAYLDKYAGRYTSLHLSDYDPQMDDGVAVGSGVIDWTALFRAARKSDISDYGYIVEVGSEEPFAGVTKSIEYLKNFSM